MADGECNCGAVAFLVNTELKDAFDCHCSMCRKSTGSNGIPMVVVSNTAFRLLHGKGSIVSWKNPDTD
ncbi:MAG: GFA family protein [Roseibium sp.]|nr:GFA family protein [Roseibium sp.]